MNVRKHIRTRRLDKIEQLGRDRIVCLTFGFEERAYHVVLEMYSGMYNIHVLLIIYSIFVISQGGNIILCNSQWTILAALRLVHGNIDTTMNTLTTTEKKQAPFAVIAKKGQPVIEIKATYPRDYVQPDISLTR